MHQSQQQEGPRVNVASTASTAQKPQQQQTQPSASLASRHGAQPNDFTLPRPEPKSHRQCPRSLFLARLSSKPPNPNLRNAHPPPLPSGAKINLIAFSLPFLYSLPQLFDFTETTIVFLVLD
ncbi:hypothetical protein GE09DRAFT_1216856 [Coniochaeta sp. 2T2.1]|nr:hypothetical protein GE09DRAFT_1216856 [Coniochaeta sp. 2T2.1]